MSFSGELKSEIYRNKALRQKSKRAFACGLLLYANQCTPQGLRLVTEHPEVCKLYYGIFAELTGAKAATTESRRRGSVLYTVACGEEVACRLACGALTDAEGLPPAELVSADSEGFGAFIAGVFLACGAITDPQKAYHLEFTPPTEALCDFLFMQLSAWGAPPKSLIRRGMPVLYYKESEPIEELITLAGASNSVLTLMRIKVYRDLRNNANRAANCVSANIDRTVDAAVRQTRAIQRIQRRAGLDSLSPELLQAAQLRLANPELSLRELHALLDTPLSRSGLNHRLERLVKLADEL